MQPNEVGNVSGMVHGNANILVPKQEDVGSKVLPELPSYMGARRVSKAKSSKNAKSVAQATKIGNVSFYNLDMYN